MSTRCLFDYTTQIGATRVLRVERGTACNDRRIHRTAQLGRKGTHGFLSRKRLCPFLQWDTNGNDGISMKRPPIHPIPDLEGNEGCVVSIRSVHA